MIKSSFIQRVKVNPLVDKELLDILLQDKEYIDTLKEIDFIDKNTIYLKKNQKRTIKEDIL